MNWSNIKYFKPSEFDSPDAPGSGQYMNLEFVEKLDKLRELYGAPLRISSGFRTIAHNSKLKNSASGSAHTRGNAADIAIGTSRMRHQLLSIIYSTNMFSRVGIYSGHIHVDIDELNPQQVTWVV